MNDDPIAVLERQLVDAARRQAHSRRSVRTFGVSRLVRGLGTAAVLVVTLVIAGGALTLLGGHHRASDPARASSGRQELIDVIDVLRRPQTPADLHSPTIARLLSTYNRSPQRWSRWGAPDLPLIRRATVTPWGEGVFLIPVKPTSGRGQEGLLWATRSFSTCCTTAADIQTFGEVNDAGHATSRPVGGRAIERFLTVVPDGVAKVQLGRLVMPVRDNVAAAQANGNLVGVTPVVFWFGSAGDVIRRIGDLVGNYRSVAMSPPGPETVASRAAERDPTTPNRVWVTPRVGGPHTAFRVHFRVLLNAADYAYTVAGSACHPLWGTRGSPDDSRGQIWSDALVPASGKSWCRGTYHLSVAVTDLGPIAILKHPAKPFGTATFLVR